MSSWVSACHGPLRACVRAESLCEAGWDENWNRTVPGSLQFTWPSTPYTVADMRPSQARWTPALVLWPCTVTCTCPHSDTQKIFFFKSESLSRIKSPHLCSYFSGIKWVASQHILPFALVVWSGVRCVICLAQLDSYVLSACSQCQEALSTECIISALGQFVTFCSDTYSNSLLQLIPLSVCQGFPAHDVTKPK